MLILPCHLSHSDNLFFRILGVTLYPLRPVVGFSKWVNRKINHLLHHVTLRAYLPILGWSLSNPAVVICLSLALLVFTFGFVRSGITPWILFPKLDSKIIEARFQVSALVRRGDEADIKELMYVVISPEKRLQVVDFEPKTQMECEFTDPVQVVETGEHASSLDGSLSIQFSPLANVHVSPSAGASMYVLPSGAAPSMDLNPATCHPSGRPFTVFSKLPFVTSSRVMPSGVGKCPCPMVV
jgi:hypothetical protein